MAHVHDKTRGDRGSQKMTDKRPLQAEEEESYKRQFELKLPYSTIIRRFPFYHRAATHVPGPSTHTYTHTDRAFRNSRVISFARPKKILPGCKAAEEK